MSDNALMTSPLTCVDEGSDLDKASLDLLLPMLCLWSDDESFQQQYCNTSVYLMLRMAVGFIEKSARKHTRVDFHAWKYPAHRQMLAARLVARVLRSTYAKWCGELTMYTLVDLVLDDLR